MYIYHALINALSAHMIHINLNMIFYTHTEHSPTKTTQTKHHTEVYIHIQKHLGGAGLRSTHADFSVSSPLRG